MVIGSTLRFLTTHSHQELYNSIFPKYFRVRLVGLMDGVTNGYEELMVCEYKIPRLKQGIPEECSRKFREVSSQTNN